MSFGKKRGHFNLWPMHSRIDSSETERPMFREAVHIKQNSDKVFSSLSFRDDAVESEDRVLRRYEILVEDVEIRCVKTPKNVRQKKYQQSQNTLSGC